MKDRSLNKPPNNALRQCSAVYYICMYGRKYRKQKTLQTYVYKALWRRRRDSNPRCAINTYTSSSRAP